MNSFNPSRRPSNPLTYSGLGYGPLLPLCGPNREDREAEGVHRLGHQQRQRAPRWHERT